MFSISGSSFLCDTLAGEVGSFMLSALRGRTSPSSFIHNYCILSHPFPFNITKTRVGILIMFSYNVIALSVNVAKVLLSFTQRLKFCNSYQIIVSLVQFGSSVEGLFVIIVVRSIASRHCDHHVSSTRSILTSRHSIITSRCSIIAWLIWSLVYVWRFLIRLS